MTGYEECSGRGHRQHPRALLEVQERKQRPAHYGDSGTGKSATARALLAVQRLRGT
jgi:ABC-type dipeptide/oligopeptide/nickel transport system ATPase subunit